MKKSISCLLLLTLALSGCSSFSKSARQQRAYAKYVRKSSMGRVAQHKKWFSGKPQLPPLQPVSDPIVTSESGPQSVTAGEGL